MPNKDNILSEMQKLSGAAPAGFALAFHIQYTRPTFLFQTYPDAWISEYSEKGMVMADPTVHWGFENDGFKRWSALADQDSGGILKLAETHGLAFGLTCAYGKDGSRSICSFARGDREYSNDECAALLACVQILHESTQDFETIDGALLKALEDLGVIVSQPGGR